MARPQEGYDVVLILQSWRVHGQNLVMSDIILRREEGCNVGRLLSNRSLIRALCAASESEGLGRVAVSMAHQIRIE